MRILDCTLRDGGFTSDWKFADGYVNSYLTYANMSGDIDIVELGYKKPLTKYDKTKYGPYFFCDENWLFQKWNVVIPAAFMLDLKDFIDESGKLDHYLLELIAGQSNFFQYARIGVDLVSQSCTAAEQAVDILCDLGYSVCLNAMRAHKLLGDNIESLLSYHTLEKLNTFYYADSYGCMLPHEIALLVNAFDAPVNLGLHLHNNLGQAYTSYVDAKHYWQVSMMDTTVGGLGRGGGNLPTEMVLYDRCKYFNNDFVELLKTYHTTAFNRLIHFQTGYDKQAQES